MSIKSPSVALTLPRPSLGDFLRARRDRLRPADFNLSGSGRRRAPGLRREEVAQLCNISPTWYTWIEQGRTTAVSVNALHAIATGLRLSRAERAYLFELAARADPAAPPACDEDPHRLSVLVNAVRTPAYVLDRHWDAIAWNRPASQLFIDWLGRRSATSVDEDRAISDRNLLRFVFLNPRARRFILNWAERERRLVAEYRADTAVWRDDPVRGALVHELCAASSEFDTAWRSQQVLSREGGQRSFQHPARAMSLRTTHLERGSAGRIENVHPGAARCRLDTLIRGLGYFISRPAPGRSQRQTRCECGSAKSEHPLV